MGGAFHKIIVGWRMQKLRHDFRVFHPSGSPQIVLRVDAQNCAMLSRGPGITCWRALKAEASSLVLRRYSSNMLHGGRWTFFGALCLGQ